MSEYIKKQLNNTLENLDLNISSDFYSGKVRENYYKDDKIIMVTSDRVSAFDHILGTIPFKGQILNEIACFWFEKTKDVIPNHFISSNNVFKSDSMFFSNFIISLINSSGFSLDIFSSICGI